MAKTKKAAPKKSAAKKVVAKKVTTKASTWVKEAKEVKTGSQVIPYIPRKIDRLPKDLNKLKK
jgi:hypothetical protein|tara:strand:+ start:608 stop:796 length:189 start_codon:yes stop_codon:yes gene_type:complete